MTGDGKHSAHQNDDFGLHSWVYHIILFGSHRKIMAFWGRHSEVLPTVFYLVERILTWPWWQSYVLFWYENRVVANSRFSGTIKSGNNTIPSCFFWIYQMNYGNPRASYNLIAVPSPFMGHSVDITWCSTWPPNSVAVTAASTSIPIFHFRRLAWFLFVNREILAWGTGVGKCTVLGILNITFKYLLQSISSIVWWCSIRTCTSPEGQ